jgi:hypothetical protein
MSGLLPIASAKNSVRVPVGYTIASGGREPVLLMEEVPTGPTPSPLITSEIRPVVWISPIAVLDEVPSTMRRSACVAESSRGDSRYAIVVWR